MVSPPSEPHSEKAHPNSPPQINLAFKGPDQDPGTIQPEGNSTHLTFFPRGGARVPGAPPRSANGLFPRKLVVILFIHRQLNFALFPLYIWIHL